MISKSDWAQLQEAAAKLLSVLARLNPGENTELEAAVAIFNDVAFPIRDAIGKNFRGMSYQEQMTGGHLICAINGTQKALSAIRGLGNRGLEPLYWWRENLQKVAQRAAELAEEEKPK